MLRLIHGQKPAPALLKWLSIIAIAYSHWPYVNPENGASLFTGVWLGGAMMLTDPGETLSLPKVRQLVCFHIVEGAEVPKGRYQ